MRIIGGKYKRRKLNFPILKEIRPATDRLKETIFNVLGQDMSGLRILDLFAGMGSLGIEAISRGAQECAFVDASPLACSYINTNLRDIGIMDQAEVMNMDVVEALEKLSASGTQFDVVFLDPPYNKGLIKKTLPIIDQSDILCAHGQMVIEHVRQEALPQTSRLSLTRCKKYGITSLSFLYRLK